MAYSITDAKIGYPIITDTGTTQKLPLGTIVRASTSAGSGVGTLGEGEFVYLQGVANTSVGSVIIYNQAAGTTGLAGSAALGDIGVAMSANGSGAFGWYQIKGAAAAITSAATAGLAAFMTTNTGTLSSAVSSGCAVEQAVFLSGTGTPSAGLALVQIDRPFSQARNS